MIIYICFVAPWVWAVTYSAPSEIRGLAPVNEFAFRLLDNVVASTEGNVAVSPISVWNLYSLLAEGSAGNTFQELMLQLALPKDLKATRALHRAVTHSLRQRTGDVDLSRKAAIFADCSLEIHQEFCQSAYSYETDVHGVDTSNKTKLADDINFYICIATEGNIRGAVRPDMLEDLKLLLVDALYFKANWTHPFNPRDTRVRPFYDQQGRKIGTVNMMYQKAPNRLVYSEELQADILEMTYGNEAQFSMIILQPQQGSSLKRLIKYLSTKPYSEWSRIGYPGGNVNVECYIPRFKTSSQLDLVQPLKYMGIYDIFDEARAQLPGLSDSQLHVSRTVQKVELEVTEEGTKAAAVTLVAIEERILAERIEVNRPFVYVIVSKESDLVLFTGVYAEPSVF